MLENEKIKNEAYNSSEFIYEDNEIIFLKCLSYDSAKYFGPEFLSDKWRDFKDYDIYIVVDKKTNPTKSYVIQVDSSDNVYIITNENEYIGSEQFLHLFPKLEIPFYKTIGPDNIYSYLKLLSLGYNYNEYKIKLSDPLIGKVNFNEKNPGKTMITLQFDEYDDFFKLFDLGNDDIWFLTQLFYGDGDLGFYHSDYAQQDWNEGYTLRDFNDENNKKVIEIASYFLPNIRDINNENSDKISKILYDTFNKQIQNIIDDHQYSQEECRSKGAKESIEGEIGDAFMDYGIIMRYPFYKYVTTVKILLSLYEYYGKKNDTLSELLKKIGDNMNFGPYYEYMYEYDCLDFDLESFNNYVSKQLDDILEEIEESDKFKDLEGFKKVSNEIRKKYEFDKWYPTPKDKELKFNIRAIDPNNNKITVIIQRQYEPLKQRSLTLDEFNSLLYNLELFEKKYLKSPKKL